MSRSWLLVVPCLSLLLSQSDAARAEQLVFELSPVRPAEELAGGEVKLPSLRFDFSSRAGGGLVSLDGLATSPTPEKTSAAPTARLLTGARGSIADAVGGDAALEIDAPIRFEALDGKSSRTFDVRLRGVVPPGLEYGEPFPIQVELRRRPDPGAPAVVEGAAPAVTGTIWGRLEP